MSAETTLVAVLEADSGVGAIVADRIFPDLIPEDETIPAVSYVRGDTEFVQTIHGTAPLGATASFDVTCVALTRVQADALADAVTTALAAGGFIIQNRSGAFDLEANLWASVVSVLFNE